MCFCTVYLTLQTLYDKKASIYLRPEDAFRLQLSGAPETADTYSVWDHKPDQSAYSMEYSVSGDEAHVRIGKRQSGLFRFMSNTTTDLIEGKSKEPLFVFEMNNGIPEGADASIFENGTEELQPIYQNWLIRNYQLKKRTLSVMDVLLSDNGKARRMLPDGSYERVTARGKTKVIAQEYFCKEATQREKEIKKEEGTASHTFKPKSSV